MNPSTAKTRSSTKGDTKAKASTVAKAAPTTRSYSNLSAAKADRPDPVVRLDIPPGRLGQLVDSAVASLLGPAAVRKRPRP